MSSALVLGSFFADVSVESIKTTTLPAARLCNLPDPPSTRVPSANSPPRHRTSHYGPCGCSTCLCPVTDHLGAERGNFDVGESSGRLRLRPQSLVLAMVACPSQDWTKAMSAAFWRVLVVGSADEVRKIGQRRTLACPRDWHRLAQRGPRLSFMPVILRPKGSVTPSEAGTSRAPTPAA